MLFDMRVISGKCGEEITELWLFIHSFAAEAANISQQDECLKVSSSQTHAKHNLVNKPFQSLKINFEAMLIAEKKNKKTSFVSGTACKEFTLCDKPVHICTHSTQSWISALCRLLYKKEKKREREHWRQANIKRWCSVNSLMQKNFHKYNEPWRLNIGQDSNMCGCVSVLAELWADTAVTPPTYLALPQVHIKHTHTLTVISRQPTFLTGTTYLTPAEYSLVLFASFLQFIFHSSSLLAFPLCYCSTCLSHLVFLIFSFFLPSPNSSPCIYIKERKSDSHCVNHRGGTAKSSWHLFHIFAMACLDQYYQKKKKSLKHQEVILDHLTPCQVCTLTPSS